MPEDSGMAFVVILHLSPDYESNLAAILQQRTTMPVLQISQPVTLEPNHVYVIPPSKHLAMRGADLVPLDPQQPLGRRLVIDLFFRTLSAVCGPRAIAIVLSGTDSDGIVGIKHIKEQGGLTLTQDPEEAEFDGMPRGAIATGMVDWVLPVQQMASRLMEFVRNEERMHLPPEMSDEETNTANSGGPTPVTRVSSATDEDALAEVLRHVRIQTGHDLAYYKRATILRRVARRLQVNLLDNIPTYVSYLQTHPAEVTALLHDLLISVTNFFRDKESFTALEAHIPQLFADKRPSDQVRVWVAGCATGEEAYTIAMLLSEHAARLESPPSIVVFATDLDESAIQIGRSGVYPATIEADISTERLRLFFHKEDGRYRVKKELRERVLFSSHDVLQDSPFSRLDMISCRNLLIYLKQQAQAALFDLFQFALRPGGLLFLGSSENLDDGVARFAVIEKRHRLFVRRTVPRASLPTTALNMTASRDMGVPLLPRFPIGGSRAHPHVETTVPERRPQIYADVHFTLLERFAPPSVVISSNHDVVHLTENAHNFLQIGAGEMSSNLLKLVHPDLRVELRTGLFRAEKDGARVTVWRVPLELHGVRRLLNLHIRPTFRTEGNDGFTLIVFELLPDAEETAVADPSISETLQQRLEAENQHLKERLSRGVEQYEASLEELKASNEELQAVNEEMRATAEELETSKEELQSVNEELSTVNQELKSKVDELSRSNSDLQNLMASTQIGTIFLDRQLRIKRFTPSAQEVFNLIAGDEGRPLAHLTHKLNYPDLAEDAEHVPRDLRTVEREVSSGGRWYMARILPYRTFEDYVDGVVLTFIDVTARKQAEEALFASEERYRLAVEGALEYAIMLFDSDGICTGWSRGAALMFEYTPEEVLGRATDFIYTPEDRAQGVSDQEREQARRDGRAGDERWHLRKGGSRFYVSGVTTALRGDDGGVRGFVKVAQDLTIQRETAEALRASEERYRLTVENIYDYAIFTVDADEIITSWNEGAKRVNGHDSSEVLGQHSRMFYTEEDKASGKPEQVLQRAANSGRCEVEGWRARKGSVLFWVNDVTTAMCDETGTLRGFVQVSRDLTERKKAERERLDLERESTMLTERNRLAQDLHDTLAQGFTGIRLQMEVAESALQETPPDVEEGLRHIIRARDIAQQSHQDARHAIRALRSPIPENGTLNEALERLAAEAKDGAAVSFASEGTAYGLSALAENSIYRVVQEALNNALRHAQANAIQIVLAYEHDQVRVSVQDDGRGFSVGHTIEGLGIRGMRERARLLGAEISIESSVDNGTRVELVYSAASENRQFEL